MDTLLLSLVIGTGLMFTLSRVVKWKYLMKYHILFDVLFTVALPLLFAGSMQGMTMAVLSGITLSIWLFAFKTLTPNSLTA